ncbi:MAG TPA: hypothetical protein VLF89_00915 [Candidatus Saccharimonadales bacterium]|nr:hypothetical protein [Candidatus Saccharimonadales bacterium]
MKTNSTRYSFTDVLRHLAKQNPEENLRNAFNLWQFAKDLQDKKTKYKYARRKFHTSGTTA